MREHEAWVDAVLAGAGLERLGPFGDARDRPWGSVRSVPTSGGTAWLKVPGPAVAFEVGLYALLAERDPDAVLVPLGIDVDAGRLLLPDGGATLQERTADDLPARHRGLAAALARYARLQRRLLGDEDALLAAGVADMRPAAIPERLEAVGALADPRDDATAAVLRRIGAAAERLAGAPGGASLDHNDLHAANVLAGPRFFDWGDAMLAHPFACLLVPVGTAAWSLGARPDDPRVTAIRDAYLAEWADLAPHDELVRVAELACTVAKAARVLAFRRAMEPDREMWRSALPGCLRTLRDPSPYAVA